ncbi:hypothetical protein GCM10007916_12830 [Psychromonas marina]|uniref:PilZ domain-containing protein n=1 Tax=Psychromonas marina TaxID=88364 RepID=A0ABQ6DYH0_9GAMM|nr:PilZ domain-containing protein [Psychromonas marina]GLS90216.1 hypothetical protein GCM10007916_12830 [Psychromonas marina]
MQLTQAERRAFERLSFTSQVIISHHGVDQKVDCKDVNAEGMSLYLAQHDFTLHDEIAVQFDDSDPHFPALNADAELIRIQPLESGFLIAVEFVAIY